MWTEDKEFAEGTLSELIEAIVATPVPTAAGEATTGVDGNWTFLTTCPDWWGGERTFGGMVVAQALSAAMQTVAEDVEIHSLHGYFLLPARPGTPSNHGAATTRREIIQHERGCLRSRGALHLSHGVLVSSG
jgi:hypothetical protein